MGMMMFEYFADTSGFTPWAITPCAESENKAFLAVRISGGFRRIGTVRKHPVTSYADLNIYITMLH